MADAVTVEVDTRKLVAAFARFPVQTRSEVRKAMGVGTGLIAEGGRKQHRYNNPPHTTSYGRPYRPSGNLERSTMSEVSADGFSGRAYLDDGIAQYGKYIHGGFGSWEPDEFLYESAERNKENFKGAIEQGIANAIRKAGL